MIVKTEHFGCLGSLIIFLLIITAIIGEVLCVVKCVKSDWDPIGKRELVYAGAFVTGIGSIVGWFDIEDSKTNIIPADVEPVEKDSIVIVTDTIHYNEATLKYMKKQDSLYNN